MYCQFTEVTQYFAKVIYEFDDILIYKKKIKNSKIMPVSKLIMVVENKSIPEFEFPVRAGHPL